MKINILWNKLTSFGSLLLILGSSHVSATNYECFEPYYLEKGGCFTGVDILYWAAFQKNLEFASMEDIDSETTEPHLAGPGSIRFMEYDWNPGLRAYFGYQSPCDFWDARIIYTYYHAEAVKNIMDSNDQDSFQYSAALLIPTTPGLAEGFQCGQGKTTLDYTTIDLQAGLTIDCLRRSLIVHPYFGLRFLEIDRDLTAHYDNELLPGFIGTDSDIIRDAVDYHYDFRGAGLHLGMDITHHLFCNVNFVSDCATSLIIGESDIQYKQLVQTKVGEEFITQETLVDLSEKECILVPGIHISGAFEWRYDCRNCQYCICRTGYEFHYWFQTPQFRKIFETGKTLDANDGNLGLHGAFIKLEYHF